jgi:hypothetical protein
MAENGSYLPPNISFIFTSSPRSPQPHLTKLELTTFGKFKADHALSIDWKRLNRELSDRALAAICKVSFDLRPSIDMLNWSDEEFDMFQRKVVDDMPILLGTNQDAAKIEFTGIPSRQKDTPENSGDVDRVNNAQTGEDLA